MSEDVVWDTPGTPDAIPHAGLKRGREGVADFFSTLAATEEITHFEPREFVAQGDKVVVEGNYKGSVTATRRQYDIDWLQVFTIDAGKIKSFREYLDTAALGDAHRAAASAGGAS
jgi:ketosteroid isomerase-like protein